MIIGKFAFNQTTAERLLNIPRRKLIQRLSSINFFCNIADIINFWVDIKVPISLKKTTKKTTLFGKIVKTGSLLIYLKKGNISPTGTCHCVTLSVGGLETILPLHSA